MFYNLNSLLATRGQVVRHIFSVVAHKRCSDKLSWFLEYEDVSQDSHSLRQSITDCLLSDVKLEKERIGDPVDFLFNMAWRFTEGYRQVVVTVN